MLHNFNFNGYTAVCYNPTEELCIYLMRNQVTMVVEQILYVKDHPPFIKKHKGTFISLTRDGWSFKDSSGEIHVMEDIETLEFYSVQDYLNLGGT